MVDVTNPEELEKAIQKNTKVRVVTVLTDATYNVHVHVYQSVNDYGG